MSDLVLIWGDCALSVDMGGFFSVGLGSRTTRNRRNSKERGVQMRIKNEEAPESRKSCSGAVRGLVNLFPWFSEFQDFILTRPHFYSSEQIVLLVCMMLVSGFKWSY